MAGLLLFFPQGTVTAIMWMSCLEDKETGQSTYRRDGVIALTNDPASPVGVGLQGQTLGDNLDSPGVSD